MPWPSWSRWRRPRRLEGAVPVAAGPDRVGPDAAPRARVLLRVATALACLAALPQLITYAGYVRRGDYPGSAYQPRLDAMIEVSRTASAGGPLAAMGGPLQFRGVERIQPDLGVSIVADLLGRARGRPIGLRTLGTLNLAFLAAALFGLIAVLPAPYHAGLIPVFLFVPLYSQAYVSADIPTIHGALSVLAFLLAVVAARGVPPWAALLVGLSIFVLHRFRAAYGLYCMATMLAVSAWIFWRRREKRLLIAPTGALAAVIALAVAWNVGIGRRAQDERFADKDVIGTHDVFKPLVSGVGWTPNRWDIEPWDPRVAQFMADRLGLQPVGVFTGESERRARIVYTSLWQEAPRHLVRLYLARVPGAFLDQFVMGRLGVGLWLAAAGIALARGWKRRETGCSPLIVGAATMVLCVVAQSVVLDPRPLYAYPLKVLSALSLSVSLTSIAILGLGSGTGPSRVTLTTGR
jgi:hypothetical protein